jgi:hypothetical protein
MSSRRREATFRNMRHERLSAQRSTQRPEHQNDLTNQRTMGQHACLSILEGRLGKRLGSAIRLNGERGRANHLYKARHGPHPAIVQLR